MLERRELESRPHTSMARQSSDREDLMAEAVALLPRIALRVSNLPSEIIAGRRVDGRWSIFMDGDPVYQFDSEHRLRRAFVNDSLYRSQGTTLARLTRQQTAQESVLLRHDLTADELSDFFHHMRRNLQIVFEALSHGTAEVINRIPEDSDYLAELTQNLQNVLQGGDALSPALTRR